MAQTQNSTEALLEQKLHELYDIEASHNQLLKELVQLQRKAAITRIVDLVTDDMYSLVAGIKGFASYLERDITHPAHSRHVTHILQASDALESIITRINDYAVQSQQQSQRCDVKSAISAATEHISTQMDTHLLLNLNIPQEELVTEAHMAQLTDMITQMLNHPANWAHEEDAALTVSAAKRDSPVLFDKAADSMGHNSWQGENVDITIAHDVLAAAPDSLADIFPKNPNSLYHMSHAKAEGMLAAHSGELRLVKEENGYFLQLTLPLIDAHNSDSSKDASTAPKARILVVDDEPVVASVLTKHLEHMGHEVGYVQSAKEAIAVLSETAEHHWDIVISDNIMPQMRGSELISYIQKAFPLVYCILCSGYQEERGLKDASFLKKPISLDALEAVLEVWEQRI